MLITLGYERRFRVPRPHVITTHSGNIETTPSEQLRHARDIPHLRVREKSGSKKLAACDPSAILSYGWAAEAWRQTRTPSGEAASCGSCPAPIEMAHGGRGIDSGGIASGGSRGWRIAALFRRRKAAYRPSFGDWPPSTSAQPQSRPPAPHPEVRTRPVAPARTRWLILRGGKPGVCSFYDANQALIPARISCVPSVDALSTTTKLGGRGCL